MLLQTVLLYFTCSLLMYGSQQLKLFFKHSAETKMWSEVIDETCCPHHSFLTLIPLFLICITLSVASACSHVNAIEETFCITRCEDIVHEYVTNEKFLFWVVNNLILQECQVHHIIL